MQTVVVPEFRLLVESPLLVEVSLSVQCARHEETDPWELDQVVDCNEIIVWFSGIGLSFTCSDERISFRRAMSLWTAWLGKILHEQDGIQDQLEEAAVREFLWQDEN